MEENKKNREKGLNMFPSVDTSEAYTPDQIKYNKVRVGLKQLVDAILTTSGDLKKVNPRLADKKEVLQAIDRLDNLKLV